MRCARSSPATQPPGSTRVEQIDVFSRCQVQSQSARLQADQEQLAVGVILESFNAGLPVARRTVEVFVLELFLVEAPRRIARKLVNCEKTSTLWPSSNSSTSCGSIRSNFAESSLTRFCQSIRDGARPGANGAALRAPGSSISDAVARDEVEQRAAAWSRSSRHRACAVPVLVRRRWSAPVSPGGPSRPDLGVAQDEGAQGLSEQLPRLFIRVSSPTPPVILKIEAAPSIPGFRNSNRLHNSPRWFSIGVPLSARR